MGPVSPNFGHEVGKIDLLLKLNKEWEIFLNRWFWLSRQSFEQAQDFKFQRAKLTLLKKLNKIQELWFLEPPFSKI